MSLRHPVPAAVYFTLFSLCFHFVFAILRHEGLVKRDPYIHIKRLTYKHKRPLHLPKEVQNNERNQQMRPFFSFFSTCRSLFHFDFATLHHEAGVKRDPYLPEPTWTYTQRLAHILYIERDLYICTKAFTYIIQNLHTYSRNQQKNTSFLAPMGWLHFVGSIKL